MVFRLVLFALAASFLVGEPLPAVKDWNSVRITLSRQAGFCACSSYEVQVRGEGLVVFNGRRSVLLPGEHFAPIARAELEALVEEFRKAGFATLSGSYGNTLDASVYTVSIAFDGRPELTIVDRTGGNPPPGLKELQEAIDRVANTDRWVDGNDETVAALLLEKYKFDSSIVSWALSRGGPESARKLREAAADNPALARLVGEFDERRSRR